MINIEKIKLAYKTFNNKKRLSQKRGLCIDGPDLSGSGLTHESIKNHNKHICSDQYREY